MCFLDTKLFKQLHFIALHLCQIISQVLSYLKWFAYQYRSWGIIRWRQSHKIECTYLSMPCKSSLWWRHQMESFSTSLALCAGNSPVPGEVPSQRPMTRSFEIFFDLSKRLSKQLWGWWFATPPHPLRRQSNVRLTDIKVLGWVFICHRNQWNTCGWYL